MSGNEPESTESSDDTSAPGPGATLKSARLERELSLEDVSTDLRIEPHLLHALEDENYAALGAPVFAKGYIRQYASRMGIDAAPLVDGYTHLIGNADVRVQPSRVIKLRDGSQATVWIVTLLALAVLVVFLVLWWLNNSSPAGGDAGAATAVPETLPFPDDALPDAVMPAPQSAAAVAADRSTTGVAGRPVLNEPSADAPRSAARSAAAAVQNVSGRVRDVGGAVAAETAEGSVQTQARAEAGVDPDAGFSDAPPDLTESVVPTAAATVADTAADGPIVSLRFIDASWVEAEDAAGTQLLYGLVEAGQERTVTGEAPYDLFFGNIDAVRIRVDGREFTVPEGVRRGNLARFPIGATTH